MAKTQNGSRSSQVSSVEARREYLAREPANFGSNRKLTLELAGELRLPQPRTGVSGGWGDSRRFSGYLLEARGREATVEPHN